jgi:hypothetical protein
MALCFKIKKINIYESYFNGTVDFDGQEYTINIQDERRGKVLKMPFFPNPKKERVLVRLSGPNGIFVEDYIPYKGKSEWVEIDSDQITFFLADHQDQFDTLEVIPEPD